MAATFSDLGTIANDVNFRSRVDYAMFVQAVTVYNETANPKRADRIAFAIRVFNGVGTKASLAVLTDPTVIAEANLATTPGFGITDAHIQAAVVNLWNALAGA
jgi:hypothetical protein